MDHATADDNVFDFNALLHPSVVFETPREVLNHSGLTLAEKRAILASWASDASTIAHFAQIAAAEVSLQYFPDDAMLDRL